MGEKDVDKEIRKAVASVRKRRILDRVVEVIQYFKGEKMEMFSDRTKVTGRTVLSIGGGSTEFTEQSMGHYHDSLLVEVRYGGSLMFSATRGDYERIADGVDPRRVIRRFEGGSIRVDTFRPGLWMQLLNLKRLIRQQEALKKRRERERQAELRRQAKPEPVREDDRALAERFAIRDLDVFLGR